MSNVAWLYPNLEPHLKNPNKMTSLIVVLRFAEGRRCSANSHSGKRAVRWHNTFSSNHLQSGWPHSGCARACQLLPVDWSVPECQRMSSGSKQKAIKESFTSTWNNNVMPGLMKPWYVFIEVAYWGVENLKLVIGNLYLRKDQMWVP